MELCVCFATKVASERGVERKVTRTSPTDGLPGALLPSAEANQPLGMRVAAAPSQEGALVAEGAMAISTGSPMLRTLVPGIRKAPTWTSLP